MGYITQSTYVVSGVIASAVSASGGTFTVAYPAGTSQQTFDTGLDGASGYIMLNDNDKVLVGSGAGTISLAYGASNITVTNNLTSAIAAGTTFKLNLDVDDGNDVVELAYPFEFAKLANGDVVTEARPGIAGTIEYAEVIITDPVTTAAKAATLNLEIDTTNCTGGTIALTSANSTPLGKTIPSAAFTGANVLTAASKLSVEASSVTTFVEGKGVLKVRIRRSGNL